MSRSAPHALAIVLLSDELGLSPGEVKYWTDYNRGMSAENTLGYVICNHAEVDAPGASTHHRLRSSVLTTARALARATGARP